jgi:DNA invertase Pin-like site-specific DNA recombinase
MKFYGYIRVSGASQIDGDGPDRQANTIDAFLKTSPGSPEIAEYFFDKAVSGTVEGMERPDFIRLISRAQPGDAIVVERLDRLARTLMVQEVMLAECRKRGILVYASDQPMLDQADTGADPTRKLIRQVIGAVAEWEKSAMVLKLHKARAAKRAATGRCEGSKPYGQYPGEATVIATAENLHGHILETGRAENRRKHGVPL